MLEVVMDSYLLLFSIISTTPLLDTSLKMMMSVCTKSQQSCSFILKFIDNLQILLGGFVLIKYCRKKLFFSRNCICNLLMAKYFSARNINYSKKALYQSILHSVYSRCLDYLLLIHFIVYLQNSRNIPNFLTSILYSALLCLLITNITYYN